LADNRDHALWCCLIGTSVLQRLHILSSYGVNCVINKVRCDWLKPNSITLASSELAPNMFGASSELASVMEFGV